MTRLVFSERAYVRKLQVSRCQVFAFVEGGLDRPYCDRFLSLQSQGKWSYQVVAARELPGDTGGKRRVVNFYRALKRRRLLSFDAFGKQCVCTIFLDKDVDDLSRRVLRSAHVFYTKTYDLEGDLFTYGDLARAVADACGLTTQQAVGFLGNQQQWLKQQASKWLDWTTLCVLSHRHGVNTGSTFERTSAINPGLIGLTDSTILAAHKNALAQAIGLPPAAFVRTYSRLRKTVEADIASGRPLRLFKGKWLLPIVEKQATQSLNVPDANLNSMGQKVLAALIAQVGIHGGCALCARHGPAFDQLAQAL